MQENPDTSLIVIDTMQKVRGSFKEGTLYANDCKEMGLIKAFADKYNIAVVLVHHAKKGFELDPQDSISGTNGIAGTADSNLVLKRHSRYESVAVLSVSGRDVTAREIHLSMNEINCVWEKLLDTYEEKESERVSKMIKNFLEKEKSFVGTATELCARLNEMYHESFAANSLGKKLNCYRIVMKKYGINYDNTRLHDKRQISLTLNLPREESKEPDDLAENVSLSNKETALSTDESQCISKDEFEFKEGQIYRERLDMSKPTKEESDYTHSEQIHHKLRKAEDEKFSGESFSFRMQDKS